MTSYKEKQSSFVQKCIANYYLIILTQQLTLTILRNLLIVPHRRHSILNTGAVLINSNTSLTFLLLQNFCMASAGLTEVALKAAKDTDSVVCNNSTGWHRKKDYLLLLSNFCTSTTKHVSMIMYVTTCSTNNISQSDAECVLHRLQQ